MVGFSHLLTKQWYVLLHRSSSPLVGGFLSFKRSKWGRPHWDAFKLRIPMKIGDVVQKVAIARWSRTFSALTTAGVPIIQAIEITGKTAGNAVIERVDGRRDRLGQGRRHDRRAAAQVAAPSRRWSRT